VRRWRKEDAECDNIIDVNLRGVWNV